MAKKVEIEVDVTGNVVESTANLRKLKAALKDVPAGTAEWSKIKNQIRDVEDALESANQSSEDFKGLLENAPGPLGALGGAIKKVELATKSWGAALKATGIGLIVAAVGGLVAAFTQTEGAMKKLEPLWIGLEKILGGIFTAFEPILDAFIEMAMTALPYITKGIGIFYSSLYGLFTLLKEAGVGAGKILKGIFTLDFDSISEGYEQIKGSVSTALDAGVKSMERFEAGTKKMTKTEKENAQARADAAKKAQEAAQNCRCAVLPA
jgi:phage-related protein